jgi:hypothetical protein
VIGACQSRPILNESPGLGLVQTSLRRNCEGNGLLEGPASIEIEGCEERIDKNVLEVVAKSNFTTERMCQAG